MSFSQNISLSQEQQKILEADGNIVVVAGAGTGKTETLTQRVLHLLGDVGEAEKGALALHEFVALTFTDKAAGEMRQRIYQSLLRRLVAAKNNEERARWRALCASFAESNRIGTFDAFNNRLLSAYPEYQFAPTNFAPMSDFDERALEVKLSRAFWHWIESLEPDDELREDVFLLLAQFERKTLIVLIGQLAREEKRDLDNLAAPILREDFQIQLREIAFQSAVKIERRAARKIENLWRHWENALREISDLPPELQALLQDESEIQNRFEEIFTATTTFRKKWIAADWKQACAVVEAQALPFLKDWREARNELEKQLSSLRESDANFDLDWRGRCFLGAAARLAQWWKVERAEFCRRENKLDFESVQRASLELLETHQEVADRIKTGTRFLMVDEFQDTNFVQWRLVDAIRDENNLMLIGDGKQSIYGFRGGDITVFDEVRADYLKNYQTLPLSVSQRATPNLTDFFNALFQEVLPGENAEREAWEAPFQELHSAREANPASGVTVLRARDNQENQSDNLELEGDKIESTSSESGNIADAFYADSESVWPLIAKGKSETEMLAETTALFLREIQEDAEALRAQSENYQWLQPKFESVARQIAEDKAAVIGVLFRTHAVKAIYETALRKHDVRYASVKGIGFYQSQPVFDAINILRFLFDAHDSLAVTGVLRAPIIGASDVALLELKRVQTANKSASLWAALEARCENTSAEYSLSDADEWALREGFRRMKQWREWARELFLSAVLEKIWNQTEIVFSDALTLDAAQRRQNWRKILDIMRAQEEQGRGSARALSEYFFAQASEGEKEADAELPEGGSVQLMTIHGAKGLGFEMTIVAQMDGTFNSPAPLWRKGALENRDDIFYAINLEETENEASEGAAESSSAASQKPLLWTILQEESRARDESEFARLFYVACTRARDFLVFAMPDEPKKASWAKMAAPFLQDKPQLFLSELQARVVIRESVLPDLKSNKNCAPISQLQPMFNTEFLRPLPIELGCEISVTQLLEFQKFPVEKVLQSTPLLRNSAENRRFLAHDPRLHGEVFHRLMRVMLENKLFTDSLNNEKLIAQFCRNSGLPSARAGILERQIEAAWSWLKDQNFDLSRARSEVAFSLPAEIVRVDWNELDEKTDWLNGVIDLIIPREDNWSIVDFKTHGGTSAPEELMAARNYKKQVALYRRACEYSGLDVRESWVVFLDEVGNAKAFSASSNA